jgi:hypothetical protein
MHAPGPCSQHSFSRVLTQRPAKAGPIRLKPANLPFDPVLTPFYPFWHPFDPFSSFVYLSYWEWLFECCEALHKCHDRERICVCALSWAKLQSKLSEKDIQKRKKPLCDIHRYKIKLLSKVHIYKKSVCSTDTKEFKAGKQKERKDKSGILCKSCCFFLMQPSYGLPCVGVTPS